MRRRIVILCVSLLCLSGIVVLARSYFLRKYSHPFMRPPQVVRPPQDTYFSVVPEGGTQTEFPPVSEEAFLKAFHDDEVFSLIDSATIREILERFGEPISFTNGARVCTRLRLPSKTVYTLKYPSGVEFVMQGEKPVRIVFTKPGHFFRGTIQIGSSLEEVLALVGPPKGEPRKDFWTVCLDPSGGSNPWKPEKERVLLTSDSLSLFWNEKERVHFNFDDKKVREISLLRANASTQPPERHQFWEDILYRRSDEKPSLIDPVDWWWSGLFRSRDCRTSLQEIGVYLKKYSENSRQMWYPRLDSRPGHFMFRAEDVCPQYLPDTRLLVCPQLECSGNTGNSAEASYARVNDESYWYLGHAMTDEIEGVAFLESYRDAVRNGCKLEDDLEIPYKVRAGTLGHLVRIRPWVGRFYIFEAMSAPGGPPANHEIPVLIERPGHHHQKGGHVLFLDGHVEFMPYPGKWPMTKKTIQILNALDQMGPRPGEHP